MRRRTIDDGILAGDYFGWRPRKTAAQRRADADRAIQKATRRGAPMAPVAIAGRTIARTFWGKAWCDNLERYRDFAHRLERGRSYVRSGSVIDLQIGAGTIAATVIGTRSYEVTIDIDAVETGVWRAIQRDCAGSIGSLVELLGGKLSASVMARLCADQVGLFPAPRSIRFTCSCPDYAIMCKHVVAAMYGVGARLDHAPALLFELRRVSADELLSAAMTDLPAARPSTSQRLLATDGPGALFGIELANAEAPTSPVAVANHKPTSRAPKAQQRPKPKPPTKPRPATRVESHPKARRRRRR